MEDEDGGDRDLPLEPSGRAEEAQEPPVVEPPELRDATRLDDDDGDHEAREDHALGVLLVMAQDTDASPDADATATTASDDDDLGTMMAGAAPWVRRNVRDVSRVLAASTDSGVVVHFDDPAWDPARLCEECERRRRWFRCRDCALELCFRCADAIHIVSSLADHGIEFLPSSGSTTPAAVGSVNPQQSTMPSVDADRPPSPQLSVTPASVVGDADVVDADTDAAVEVAHPETAAPLLAAATAVAVGPPTEIEHRLHLPIGAKLFFRADDCGRWPRELLHGTIVGRDHSVRADGPGGPAFFYRVLWLRGVEALANGFFRASLVLPPPAPLMSSSSSAAAAAIAPWPIEIGLFPSQLAAFRAVLTAERLGRTKYRRERISGRRRALAGFPSGLVLDEILRETEAILGLEFRVRLTQRDDAACLEALSRGDWHWDEWLRGLGRGDDLIEERVAVAEEEAEEEEGDRGEGVEGPAPRWWSPRQRVRLFLLEERALLLPEALQRTLLARILGQMLFVFAGFAWQRWTHFVARHRRHERRERRTRAATRLQHWLRGCRRRWREQQEQQQQQQHPLLGLGALELYRRRQAEAAKLYAFLQTQYAHRQRRALRTWAAHAGLGNRHCPMSTAVSSSWRHPSHGIAGLPPRLPRVFAFTRPDGSLGIEDIAQYRHFGANHAGPTPTSYWLLRHWVLAGTYPSPAAVTRSLLLQARVGTFVCLAEAAELAAHEPLVDASCLLNPLTTAAGRKGSGAGSERCTTPWLFERLVRATHAMARGELEQGVKLATRQCELARRELELAPAPTVPTAPGAGLGTSHTQGSAPSHRVVGDDESLETLTNKLALAEGALGRAHEALATHPPLAFVHFPIPHDGLPGSLEAFEGFLQDLERRLAAGERLYVFSMHGHGRTGLVGAALLGRLYGLPARDALDRAQRTHDAQPSLRNGPGGAAAPAISSPKTTHQAAFVRQLLARANDAVYAPVVNENPRAGHVSWRQQLRGTPIDRFADREGFMISARPDSRERAEQQREHEHRQRIARRETTAARLTFERRRAAAEREAMAHEDVHDHRPQ